MGKGVSQAVAFVNGEINARLVGHDSHEQQALDEALVALDGTDNKGRLGANATLAVSLAACKAAASASQQQLFQHINTLAGTPTMRMPVPMMNILNGGEHADNNVDIQEFMVQPVGLDTFSEALRCGTEIFHHLKKHLQKLGLSRRSVTKGVCT